MKKKAELTVSLVPRDRMEAIDLSKEPLEELERHREFVLEAIEKTKELLANKPKQLAEFLPAVQKTLAKIEEEIKLRKH